MNDKKKLSEQLADTTAYVSVLNTATKAYNEYAELMKQCAKIDLNAYYPAYFSAILERIDFLSKHLGDLRIMVSGLGDDIKKRES